MRRYVFALALQRRAISTRPKQKSCFYLLRTRPRPSCTNREEGAAPCTSFTQHAVLRSLCPCRYPHTHPLLLPCALRTTRIFCCAAAHSHDRMHLRLCASSQGLVCPVAAVPLTHTLQPPRGRTSSSGRQPSTQPTCLTIDDQINPRLRTPHTNTLHTASFSHSAPRRRSPIHRRPPCVPAPLPTRQPRPRSS